MNSPTENGKKNQGFERPQRRRCGLLHFPAALIRPSLGLR
ncbi:transposase [Xanthomonas oryzae pv. oryzae PXO99A]|uniref:Transposase n=1 Tax=Xanthomonas oryzae pv. oryzae (strain PXO99A) TaxID=360094 RepID=A0A0K0GR76_XANOP|nr:transposase [Xanthomonas oryzae pv. oryzae PXO99A]